MSTPETHPAKGLRMWDAARRLPLGNRLFSLVIRYYAPYFRTARPRIEEMRAGRVVVTAPTWWGVRNHIGTFHVIAACNLAETAMGMICEATIPSTHRWIPKGMTTSYPAKSAKSGRVTCVAELPEIPDFGTLTEGRDLSIPISITDASGTEFLTGEITVWVSPSD